MNFKLKARVSRSDARTIQQALDQLAAKGSVKEAAEGFVIEAELEGASAKELNRTLLSILRRVQRKTTLRSEWTSGDGTTERFFDYVLKKTTKY
jgi:phosphoribosylformylglycinamidine (FGAM) synthase PurS component